MLCPIPTTPKTEITVRTSFCHDQTGKLTTQWQSQNRGYALKHSQTHFVTAKGSPFTTDPLNQLLQYDGLTSFGNMIYKGKHLLSHYQFDKPTTAILLYNLHQKVPIDASTHSLDYSSLLDGIKNWPEHTTMSASGHHLGIYKTLGKHVAKSCTKTDQTSIPTPA